MYFYEVNITGYETYIPKIVIHPNYFSEENFIDLTLKALVQAMTEGWTPDEYEMPEKAVEYLVRDFGFYSIKIESVVSFNERIFSDWFSKLRKGYFIKPIPYWIPKDLVQQIEDRYLEERYLETLKEVEVEFNKENS